MFQSQQLMDGKITKASHGRIINTHVLGYDVGLVGSMVGVNVDAIVWLRLRSLCAVLNMTQSVNHDRDVAGFMVESGTVCLIYKSQARSYKLVQL